MIEYVAGLFDSVGVIDLAAKKPKIAIPQVKHGWPGISGALEQQIGGKTTKTEWRVVGWEEVTRVANMLLEDSYRIRELEVVVEYNRYRNLVGEIPEARRAAVFQLTQLQREQVIPLTFDMETMGLRPAEKEMLSTSFQWGDDEKGVFSVYREGPDDKEVAIASRNVIESAPYLIGFNSYRFDIPYLNTRLWAHGERPVFIGSHDDASVIFDRWRGRTKRTSLVKVVDELGIADDEKHKTPIDWDKWNAAYAGDKSGMDYVLEHGENDVVLTRRAYNVTLAAMGM